jgi:hypothetical protein
VADNVGYTPGSGATVAADEIGGVLFQRVKPVHGADGTATDTSSDNPLPVHDEEQHLQLTRVVAALSAPQGYDRSTQRQRVTAVVESGTVTTVSTVTTVTTVTGVTNIAGLGGDQPQLLTRGSNLSAWFDCVRSRIS